MKIDDDNIYIYTYIHTYIHTYIYIYIYISTAMLLCAFYRHTSPFLFSTLQLVHSAEKGGSATKTLASCNLEKHPEAFRRSPGQIATLRAHGSLLAEDSINAV